MRSESRILRATNLALAACLVLTACHYESCKEPLEDYPHGPDWGPVYHVRPLLGKNGPVRNDIVWGDNGTFGAYYLATQPGVVIGPRSGRLPWVPLAGPSAHWKVPSPAWKIAMSASPPSAPAGTATTQLPSVATATVTVRSARLAVPRV